ncbi:hypothetical protein [Niallia nealsonii]|uniref:Uncharacterized protein n=1 Tax=Niallia nealsonii TaxID=115979 RepID=A0A2N0Z301_9BACI|nr:hypothetical protein [Niallia nealsonii]PKG23882.1 hypothetical protein CWS01_09695 [Niallia nealsonii]
MNIEKQLISLIHAAQVLTSTLDLDKVLKPSATDKQVSNMARNFVPVVAIIAFIVIFKGGGTLVALLLMGYSLVTQLFPTLLFSLLKNNFVTKQGAFAGIFSGVLTVAYVTISGTTMGSLFPRPALVVKTSPKEV